MDSEKKIKIIKSAEEKCRAKGGRFTLKRKKIFEMMLGEKKAMSAYEIADRIRELSSSSVPMMSVYRILDFLSDHDLVHKISTINKYSICSHIACKHKHSMARLAVCLECQSVDEIASDTEIKKSVEKGLNDISFQLKSPHLELVGLCLNCSQANTSRGH